MRIPRSIRMSVFAMTLCLSCSTAQDPGQNLGNEDLKRLAEEKAALERFLSVKMQVDSRLGRAAQLLEGLERQRLDLDTTVGTLLAAPVRSGEGNPKEASTLKAMFRLWEEFDENGRTCIPEAELKTIKSDIAATKAEATIQASVNGALLKAEEVFGRVLYIGRLLNARQFTLDEYGKLPETDSSLTLEEDFARKSREYSALMQGKLEDVINEARQEARNEVLELIREREKKFAMLEHAKNLQELQAKIDELVRDLEENETRYAALGAKHKATLEHMRQLLEGQAKLRAEVERAERERLNAQIRLEQARVEAATIPLLKTLTTKGIWAPGKFREDRGQSYDQMQAHSLARLQQFGALEPGRHGLYRLHLIGANFGDDNIRPVWTNEYLDFDIYVVTWEQLNSSTHYEQLEKLQKFLREYGKELVTLGLLAP